MEAEVTGSVVAALFGLDGFACWPPRMPAVSWSCWLRPSLGSYHARTAARWRGRRIVVRWVRDLPISGRPVVVCWHKRVWCCPHALCPKKTWTEQHPAIEPRACLTDRARAWAFEQVGARDAVSRVASALGVGWATIMRIVTTAASHHRRPRTAGRADRDRGGRDRVLAPPDSTDDVRPASPT